MEDVETSTAGRHPAPSIAKPMDGFKRTNRSTMPQLPVFSNEPIYCESAHSLDDVLYSGSDDEYYDSPAVRTQRLEEQAKLFLQGRRPFLLSASLKGPFGRETGWDNPWKSRGSRAAVSESRRSNARPEAPIKTGAGMDERIGNKAVASIEQGEATEAKSGSGEEQSRQISTTLGTINTEVDSLPERRASGTDWLRRKNLKRIRVHHDDRFTASPTAVRSNKIRRLSSSSRSFSAPVEGNAKGTDRDANGFSRQGSSDGDSVRRQSTERQRFHTKKQRGQLATCSPKLARSESVPCIILSKSVPGKNGSPSTSEDALTSRNCQYDGSNNTGADDSNDETSSNRLVTSEPAGHDGRATETDMEGVQLESQQDDSFYYRKRVSRPKKNAVVSSSIAESGKATTKAASAQNKESLHSPPQADTSDSVDVTQLSSVSSRQSELSHSQEEVSDTFFDDTTLLSVHHSDVQDICASTAPEQVYLVNQKAHDDSNQQRDLPDLDMSKKVEDNELEQEQSLALEHELTLCSGKLSDTVNINSAESTTEADTNQETNIRLLKESTRNSHFHVDDNRLSTQDQSPWTKTQLTTPNLLALAFAGADTTPEDTVSHKPDHTTEGRIEAAVKPGPVQAQSPWSKSSSWQLALPVPALPGGESFVMGEKDKIGIEAGNAKMSLSQNPWVEENSAAISFSSMRTGLPTSPCSPDQDTTVQKTISQQSQAGSLLPVSVPIAPSSGTAPSTPETKQSSLPTPDLTISIKSFRRFRSPTPTPPPRHRANKTGGLRSVLVPSRRRSGVVPSAAKSGRRVRFSLPEEAKSSENESNGSPDPLYQYKYDVEVAEDEEDYIEAGLSGSSKGRLFTSSMRVNKKGAGSSHKQPHRTASPPPLDGDLAETLPSEVEKFQGHFMTVANRAKEQQRGATNVAQPLGSDKPRLPPITMLKPRGTKDPGAYSSPSVDAMASRFLEIDAETLKLQEKPIQQSPVEQRTQESKDFAAVGGNKENAWGGDGGNDEEPVDDVQAVMDNLDDFLGIWNVDAELAQARAGIL